MDDPNVPSDQPENSSTQQPQNPGDENIDVVSLPSDAVPVPRTEVVAPPVTVQTNGTVPPSPSRTADPALVPQSMNDDGCVDVTTYAGDSGEGFSKKRGRNNDPGASASDGGDQKPKRMIDATIPAVCAICGKRFVSFYSLFGHLRSHDQRTWGGAFPPPRYNPDWVKGGAVDDQQKTPAPAATREVIEEQVISALLDAAEETLAKMNGEAPRTTSREIDLNAYPQEDESPAYSTENAKTAGLDLNLPPPEEDEEDAFAP